MQQETTHSDLDELNLLSRDDKKLCWRISVIDEGKYHVNGCVTITTVHFRTFFSGGGSSVTKWNSSATSWLFLIKSLCGIMGDQVVGPFMFAETTITGATYLDMLD